MNLASIRADVRRKLRGDTYWSDTDVDAAINGAYLESCEVSKCYEAESTLALIPGNTYYNLEDPIRLVADDATPYSIPLELLRVWNPTTAKWLDIKSVREMDSYRPRWITSYGEPDTWIPRGFASFGIFPKPSGGSSSLLLRHTAVPEILVSDDDEPVTPVVFQQMLTDGALAELKGLEREPKIAMRYLKSYNEMLADLEDHVQQRTRRSHIPVIGSHPVGARR